MFKIKNKGIRAMTSLWTRVDGDLYQGFLPNIFLLKVNNRDSDSTITCKLCIGGNIDIKPRSMMSF